MDLLSFVWMSAILYFHQVIGVEQKKNEEQDSDIYFGEDAEPLENEYTAVVQRVKRSHWGDSEVDDPFAGFGDDRHDRWAQRHRDRDGRRNREERRRGQRRRKQRRRHHWSDLATQPTLPTVFPQFVVTTPTEPSRRTTLENRRGNNRKNVRLLEPVPVPPHVRHNVRSGQIIRLGGGATHAEGRVEVYQDGRWGVVCDDGWDIADANIVCKQLGFTKGAIRAVGGSAHGAGWFTENDVVMDQIRCQGFENNLQECIHSTANNCGANELAGVECHHNDGCSEGWVSGNGLCYKLLHQMAPFEKAAAKCDQLEAHLLTIESQAESDFINSWLSSVTNETYVWTAGRRVQQNGHEFWVWHATLNKIHFTKWFPGWPVNGASRQPSNHQGQDCISLARTYYQLDQSVDDVGYYFWNDAPCTIQLPYVCEKVAHFEDDCYEGTGQNYSGNVFRTERGTICQKWTDSPKINPTSHPNKGLGDHNNCRNPDEDLRPWCWVDVAYGRYGYCAVDQCPDPDASTTSSASNSASLSPTMDPRGSSAPRPANEDCPAGEVRCHSSDHRFCIPTRWLCDGDEDCPTGEDEQLCGTSLDKFLMAENTQLQIPEDSSYPFYSESHLFVSPERCADLCVAATKFVCRSFNYRRSGIINKCTLFNITSSFVGQLQDNNSHDHYEFTLQSMNCSSPDFYVCGNDRCIPSSKVCDGQDDCYDFSDEQRCSDPESNDIDVRLRGGSEEHLGRVEVKYLGEWGIICDDNWDVEDAEVVCRQLGYGGAVAATVRSEFGSGNANFLLDEVQCNGTESSLAECDHAPWKSHDCFGFEAAGVVCQVGKVCDPSTEFQCKATGVCVLLSVVCDDNMDCIDSSDEEHCYERDIGIQLVGGGSPREGRVELTINGVTGTVCDDNWDNTDAAVVCRMLGFSGEALATMKASFGAGTGPIWFDNVGCNGDEISLVRCGYSGLATHDCDHNEDAGVICMATDDDRPPFNTTPRPSPSVTVSSVPASGPLPPGCGRRDIVQPQSRIVGGHTARYGAYPWQAGLSRLIPSTGSYSHFCGGTIIADRWILTAAHCLINKRKGDMRIRVGDHDQTRRDAFEQVFDIDQIINHSDYEMNGFLEGGYDPYPEESFFDSFLSLLLGGRSNARSPRHLGTSGASVDYDIALIKLKANDDGNFIEFNGHIQPACLANMTTAYEAGTRCFVSGWGSLGWKSRGHSYPRYLQAAAVPLIEGRRCSRLYKQAVTERMLCAGYVEGGIDSCTGDSGGPLVCPINDKYTVLGVVSWGHGCAKPNSPGVYANVAKLSDWVHERLRLFS